MTAIDIDAIRKLTDAATPGPWEHDGNDGLVWGPLVGDPVSASVLPENAEFIAAARTLVPALCDELEQTRAALTASRENAANLANEVGALKAELERMRTLLATLRERLAAPDTTEQICGETPGEFGVWCRCTKPAGHTGDRHFSDFGVGTYSWGYVPSETEAEATR